MLESKLKTIPVNAIILDDKNPRLAFTKIEHKIERWSEQDMSEKIKESYPFNHLLHSIQEYGIMDPIWVHDLGNTKYRVIEGNMRVTALKTLIENNNLSTSSGINYQFVKAHIIPKNTPQKDIESHKSVLQTGKTPWGAFNEASNIYDLFWKHKLKISKIGQMLGKSDHHIDQQIDNFKIYKEFIEFLREKNLDIDPNKYSFIADATISIRNIFFKAKSSRKEYYNLIIPNEQGITKIPSVSLMKTFGKFVDDDKTLKYFLKNPKVTVSDAFEYYQEESTSKKIKWVKKIPSMTKAMSKLKQKDRIELLKNYQTKIELTKLKQELDRFF